MQFIRLRLNGLPIMGALSLFAFGAIGILSALFSKSLFTWIEAHPLALLLPSVFLLLAGILLLTQVSRFSKDFSILYGKTKISLSPELMQESLNTLLSELLETDGFHLELLSIKGNLHIFLDLPYHAEDRQKKLVAQVEKEIQQHLITLFGYAGDFLLVTSFQEPSESNYENLHL